MPSHFPRGLVSRIASLAKKQETSLHLLVVGLGNPGREHEHDRHNAGWLVLDELGRRFDARWRGKFSGQLAEVRLEGLVARRGESEGRVPELRPRRRPDRIERGRRVHRTARPQVARPAPRLAGLPAPADRRRAAGPRRSALGRRLRAVVVRAGGRRRGARLAHRGRGRDDRPRGAGSCPTALQLVERGLLFKARNRGFRLS